MTVKELILAYLRAGGYDGLWCENCGCFLDDLIPCHECHVEDCRPGYRAMSEDPDYDDEIIQPDKPEEVKRG